jgi:hypothetical protein
MPVSSDTTATPLPIIMAQVPHHSLLEFCNLHLPTQTDTDSDSKLLSEYLFIGHGNTDNNLDSKLFFKAALKVESILFIQIQ